MLRGEERGRGGSIFLMVSGGRVESKGGDGWWMMDDGEEEMGRGRRKRRRWGEGEGIQ